VQQLVPARLLDTPGAEAAREEIPADLLHQSRRRIRWAAAIGTAVYAVFLTTQPFRLTGAAAPEHAGNLVNDLVGLSVCGAVLAASLIRQIGDRAMLRIALIGEVLLAALISITIPASSYQRTGDVPSLTWVVPMIVLVPMLVSAPPTRTIAAAILCGLTMPIGLWLLDARDVIAARPEDYWGSAVAASVAVGIAAMASHAIHSTGRQVAAARRFGSYHLIERLGQGGMGEVWKARHHLLARPAAVKFIRPIRLKGSLRARDAAVRRFWLEAHRTAGLHSPHTVELFDFGESVDGSLYYAMELLDGLNFEHFVMTYGPVEPARAVDWLRQACHSLSEAHATGLFHRDLKPANLFVCRRGRDVDVVKVLDFGIAKLREGLEETTLTATGVRMGTPSWMAPELFRGQEASVHSDLYALGCVGYWLLTGHKPFESKVAAELVKMHLEAVAPPLAARAPRPVPPRVEQVVMSCLEKDPQRRPADADRLSIQLVEALDGGAWTQADARDWWGKHSSGT
jgi:eukaryotic-like serine/threonine-protein kinase